MLAAASRTFWTAGSSRPMRMAMMAITTSSSISVKPARPARERERIRRMEILLLDDEATTKSPRRPDGSAGRSREEERAGLARRARTGYLLSKVRMRDFLKIVIGRREKSQGKSRRFASGAGGRRRGWP